MAEESAATPSAIIGIGSIVVLILGVFAVAALAGFLAGGAIWFFETTWGWWS